MASPVDLNDLAAVGQRVTRRSSFQLWRAVLLIVVVQTLVGAVLGIWLIREMTDLSHDNRDQIEAVEEDGLERQFQLDAISGQLVDLESRVATSENIEAALAAFDAMRAAIERLEGKIDGVTAAVEELSAAPLVRR